MNNPLEEYNNMTKMELDEQRNYEGKIQNKDNKAADVEEENKVKKKKINNDDYNEIFKILYKNRMEKLKDNDTTQKNTEDQNMCIDYFIKGNKEKANQNEKPLLGKREANFEVIYPLVY